MDPFYILFIIIIAFFIFLVFIFSNKWSESECNSHKHCPDYDFRCVDGRCQRILCNNGSCPLGMQCSEGSCYSLKCTTNDNCPKGTFCVDGVCLPKTKCDDGCANGTKCVSGTCVQCEHNGDCPNGFCKNGFCTTSCKGTCASGEYCYDLCSKQEELARPPCPPEFPYQVNGYCYERKGKIGHGCAANSDCETSKCSSVSQKCISGDCYNNDDCDVGKFCVNGNCVNTIEGTACDAKTNTTLPCVNGKISFTRGGPGSLCFHNKDCTTACFNGRCI